MELRDYRIRPGLILGEVAGALGLGLLLVLALTAAFEKFPDRCPPELSLSLGVLILFLVWSLLRWKSRIRVDPSGIRAIRLPRTAGTRLAWEEIDELFRFGPLEFELRGRGKRIRFTDSYADVPSALQQVSVGLAGLRDRLRDQALKESELVFRTPHSRWTGHLLYLGAVLLLTALTGLVVWSFLHAARIGFPVFLVFFGGGWLWKLRARVSRLGMRVALYRDGLVVRRLDGSDKIAWSELDRTEWTARGDLLLKLRSGREILLPSTMGNISILEEFLDENRGLAGSRTE
jgi:hypothetical protein